MRITGRIALQNNPDVYIKYYVDLDNYKIYTNSLKYGKHLEIIFSKEHQCFTIKNIDTLRTEWALLHPDEKAKEKYLVDFLEAMKI